MNIYLLMCIIFAWSWIIWIALHYLDVKRYNERLEESDEVISHMIRIMWNDTYEEFCRWCWWDFKFYKFKYKKSKYYNNKKSTWKK